VTRPLISVVVPAYNCESYVSDAIESIFRQGYPDLEIIVIDDGSQDGTLQVLKRFEGRIRVFSQENRGPGAARNVGIRAASGSLIGLLDADDLWTDDHVHAMLPHLAKDSPFDLARGRTRTVNMGANGASEQIDELFHPTLVGASLYRATVFDTVGLFDERMRVGEDLDWNIRFAESPCRETRVAQTTLIYRRRPGSLTSAAEAIKQGQLGAIQRKLARSRAVKCPPQ
jgi:glycosyltransferase involved in cell wall biosynthesis